eukprot:m.18647 g.18647  ORF g.18647 m.18647 type:complete len:259 (+) comp6365_c0_seq1:103-879(+)
MSTSTVNASGNDDWDLGSVVQFVNSTDWTKFVEELQVPASTGHGVAPRYKTYPSITSKMTSYQQDRVKNWMGTLPSKVRDEVLERAKKLSAEAPLGANVVASPHPQSQVLQHQAQQHHYQLMQHHHLQQQMMQQQQQHQQQLQHHMQAHPSAEAPMPPSPPGTKKRKQSLSMTEGAIRKREYRKRKREEKLAAEASGASKDSSGKMDDMRRAKLEIYALSEALKLDKSVLTKEQKQQAIARLLKLGGLVPETENLSEE